MNSVQLIGRLTKDPVITYTQGEDSKPIARYTLAVDRIRKGPDGQTQADFISCVAFRNVAEFAERYLHKGSKIAITGSIQTGSYTDKNGNKVYTTDVIVNSQEFCESRQTAQQTAPQAQPNNYAPYNNQSGYGSSGAPQRKDQYGQQSFGDGFMDISNIPDDPDSPGLPFN